MQFSIGLYESVDAPEIAKIFRAAIVDIAPNDYLPEQVAPWLAYAPGVEHFAAIIADGRLRLVAVNEGNQVVAIHNYAMEKSAGRRVGYYAFKREIPLIKQRSPSAVM